MAPNVTAVEALMLFRPSAGEQLLRLAGVLGGLLLITVGLVIPKPGALDWLFAVAFILLGLNFVIGSALYAPELVLTREGLELRSHVRRNFHPWLSVEQIKVVTTRGKHVGLTYQQSPARNWHQKVVHGVTRIWTGCDEVLYFNYGLSAERLADFLREWRTTAQSRQSPS